MKRRRPFWTYLRLCLRNGVPWVRGTWRLVDTLISLSVAGILTAGVTVLTATSAVQGIVTGFVVAVLFLLLWLVAGGYETWRETDQQLVTALADSEREREAVSVLQRSRDDIAVVHDTLGAFIQQGQVLVRSFDRHARFQETGRPELLVGFVDEPEDLEVAARQWAEDLRKYVADTIARAASTSLFDTTELQTGPDRFRPTGYAAWRAAFGLWMPRLIALAARYEPDPAVKLSLTHEGTVTAGQSTSTAGRAVG